jgi:hypothetical protein
MMNFPFLNEDLHEGLSGNPFFEGTKKKIGVKA